MRLIILFFLTLQATFSLAQMNLEWEVNTGLYAAHSTRMLEDSEGNLLVVKINTSNGFSNISGLLQKYSPDGNLIWEFGELDVFDGQNSFYFDFALDSQNNIYLAGSQFPNTAQYQKTEIIKVSPDGTELWREDFTVLLNWSEAIEQIEITTDDRIFLIARLYNPDIDTLSPAFIEMDTEGNTVTMIMDTDFEIGYSELKLGTDNSIYAISDDRIQKLETTGDITWSVDFPASNMDYYFSRTNQNNAVVFGSNEMIFLHTISNFSGPCLGLAISRVSYSGELLSHEIINPFTNHPDLLQVEPTHVFQAPNGDIYASGIFLYGEMGGPSIAPDPVQSATETVFGGKGGEAFYMEFVIKLTAELDLVWKVENDFFPNSSETSRPVGGFFLGDNFVHATSSLEETSRQLYFTELNPANGAVNWDYTQSTSEIFNDYRPSSLFVSADDAIYCLGRGELYVDNQMQNQNEYLIKYTSEFTQNLAEASTLSASVYPNPAQSYAMITSAVTDNFLRLMDMNGALVIQTRFFSHKYFLSVEAIPAGVYHVELNGKSSRLVIVK
jgi:hypothetical protein